MDNTQHNEPIMQPDIMFYFPQSYYQPKQHQIDDIRNDLKRTGIPFGTYFQTTDNDLMIPLAIIGPDYFTDGPFIVSEYNHSKAIQTPIGLHFVQMKPHTDKPERMIYIPDDPIPIAFLEATTDWTEPRRIYFEKNNNKISEALDIELPTISNDGSTPSSIH